MQNSLTGSQRTTIMELAGGASIAGSGKQSLPNRLIIPPLTNLNPNA